MAFIYKHVVYAHRVEIDRIVFPVVDFHSQLLKRGREVLLALLQSLLHLAAAVAHGGLLQHLQIALHVGQFLREYLYHRL